MCVLQQALDEQRSSCDSILLSKDTLVGELQSDIRRRDDEYVKALIQFRKDVGASVVVCFMHCPLR